MNRTVYVNCGTYAIILKLMVFNFKVIKITSSNVHIEMAIHIIGNMSLKN